VNELFLRKKNKKIFPEIKKKEKNSGNPKIPLRKILTGVLFPRSFIGLWGNLK